MKLHLAFSLYTMSLLIINPNFTQSAPSQITHQQYNPNTALWEDFKKEIFQYDLEGNVISRHTDKLPDSSNVLHPKYQGYYDYDERGNEIQYVNNHWNERRSKWELSLIREKAYDENDLQIRQICFNFYDGAFISEEKELFYYNPQHQIDSALTFRKAAGEDTYSNQSKEYHFGVETSNWINYEKYRWSSSSNKWTKSIEGQYLTNAKSQTIESHYDYFSSSGSFNHSWFQYDHKDRLILEYISYKAFDYEGIWKDSLVYFEDENGKLFKKERHVFDHIFQHGDPVISKTTTFYTYYCDGRLKSIFEEKLSNLILRRSIYDYSTGADCKAPDGAHDFEVFPNPANSQITLKTDSWEFSNMAIQIFDILGRKQFNQTIEHQTTRLNLDISNLDEGLYFLRLDNGEDRIAKPLIIER